VIFIMNNLKRKR